MNLAPVTHAREGQRLLCNCCHTLQPIELVQADLDGPAFVAYYCESCAIEGMRFMKNQALTRDKTA